MVAMEEWQVNKELHEEFATHCHTMNNTRMKDLQNACTEHEFLTLEKYSDIMGKCKDLTKWKAKVGGSGIPPEGMLACRTVKEAIKLLAITFIAGKPIGETVSHNLRVQSFFVTPELREWLGAARA